MVLDRTNSNATGIRLYSLSLSFWQIIGLEHELKVEGKLRTLTDLKEFWDNMLAPTRSTSAAEPPPFAPPLGHGRPSSTPFTLDEDEEEEEYSDSWAITALPRQHSCTPRKVYYYCTL